MTGVLYTVQLFTEEFLHTVGVPFEDAEFIHDVPIVVQQLEHRVWASNILGGEMTQAP